MVNLASTNIVGSASKTIWSQAQTVLQTAECQTMIVVQLTCSEEDSLVDLANLGMEMLSEIEKRGDESVESIVQEMKEGLQISILIGTLKGGDLTLKGQGSVEAYLARNGQLAKLGTNVRGHLKEGDVIVLTTTNFVEMVGLDKFKETLTQEDNPAELLAPLLHTQNETSGAAAIVGEVGKDEKKTSWPQIKLKGEKVPRKLNMWVGSAILLLLVIMIGVGMVRRVKVVAERGYSTVSTSVEAKIAETISIGQLNPDQARTLLAQARSEVQAYLGTNLKEEYKQKGQGLLMEIDNAESQAFKKSEIQLTTVVELPILADGLTATKMKSDGIGNLIFLDSSNQKIVSMNLNDRSRQVIATDKADQFVDLGISEAKTFGLNSAGVTELFWKQGDPKKVIEPDEFWKNPTKIAMFAGNAYILDQDQGEIWKYPTLGDTFGGRRRWFAAGITPDLSNVVDMKVVGDIWLLTSTGKLERYSRGAPVTFSMEGFPAKDEAKKLSNPSAIWVNDTAVYVLENGASRVVVFGTDGKYQAQYANAEFAKASDLVVIDDKAYVLVDNVVKEFGL